MAVIVPNRKQGKLEVLERITDLYNYSKMLCQSEKWFPKRSRWILANRILSNVIDAGQCIAMANTMAISVDEEYALRQQWQTKAKAYLRSTLYLIELAYSEKGHRISGRQADHWTDLTEKAYKKLTAWEKSDKERREQLSPVSG